MKCFIDWCLNQSYLYLVTLETLRTQGWSILMFNTGITCIILQSHWNVNRRYIYFPFSCEYLKAHEVTTCFHLSVRARWVTRYAIHSPAFCFVLFYKQQCGQYRLASCAVNVVVLPGQYPSYSCGPCVHTCKIENLADVKYTNTTQLPTAVVQLWLWHYLLFLCWHMMSDRSAGRHTVTAGPTTSRRQIFMYFLITHSVLNILHMESDFTCGVLHHQTTDNYQIYIMVNVSHQQLNIFMQYK